MKILWMSAFAVFPVLAHAATPVGEGLHAGVECTIKGPVSVRYVGAAEAEPVKLALEERVKIVKEGPIVVIMTSKGKAFLKSDKLAKACVVESPEDPKAEAQTAPPEPSGTPEPTPRAAPVVNVEQKVAATEAATPAAREEAKDTPAPVTSAARSTHREPTAWRALGISATVVGGMGVIVGISTGAVALSALVESNRIAAAADARASGRTSQDTQRIAALNERTGSVGTVAIVTGAVGVAALATGIALWVLDEKRAHTDGTASHNLVPTLIVSPAGSQVGLVGRF
jgi:type IV secretory pathway VirB10-like protein